MWLKLNKKEQELTIVLSKSSSTRCRNKNARQVARKIMLHSVTEPQGKCTKTVQNTKKNCLNPSITKSDQHPVSPNKISVQSVDKVTRTIKMINMGKLL